MLAILSFQTEKGRACNKHTMSSYPSEDLPLLESVKQPINAKPKSTINLMNQNKTIWLFYLFK